MVSETVICACSRCPGDRGVVHALAEVARRVYQGGCTGWVYRVGNRGAIPGTHRPRKEDPYPAERAPEAPARGLEWVGYGSGCVTLCSAAGTAPGTTLRARSVTLCPPCPRTLGMPPLGQ